MTSITNTLNRFETSTRDKFRSLEVAHKIALCVAGIAAMGIALYFLQAVLAPEAAWQYLFASVQDVILPTPGAALDGYQLFWETFAPNAGAGATSAIVSSLALALPLYLLERMVFRDVIGKWTMSSNADYVVQLCMLCVSAVSFALSLAIGGAYHLAELGVANYTNAASLSALHAYFNAYIFFFVPLGTCAGIWALQKGSQHYLHLSRHTICHELASMGEAARSNLLVSWLFLVCASLVGGFALAVRVFIAMVCATCRFLWAHRKEILNVLKIVFFVYFIILVFTALVSLSAASSSNKRN